jgi:predicted HicB family RNase H-like nuclease
MKRKEKVTARQYLRVVEWSAEDRCFVGSAPPLIGRCCHGPTETNVLKQLKQIVADWVRLADKEGVVLPPPEGAGEYSGRFLLRLPAPVHQALALKARAAGKSLNAYCAERLAVL